MAKHHLPILMTIIFLVAIMSSPVTPLATSSTPTAALATSPAPAASPATAMANSSPRTAALPASSTPTAYEMLEQYNLTRGILPEGVTGYVLRQDGSFEVYLPGDCNLRAGKMQIRYSSSITGTIQTQSIHGLQGVNVKVLFAWIGITQVDVADGQIRFDAGAISKSFPVDKFANSPQCN